MLTAKKPPGSENSLPGAVLFQPQSGFHGVEEIGLVGQSNNIGGMRAIRRNTQLTAYVLVNPLRSSRSSSPSLRHLWYLAPGEARSFGIRRDNLAGVGVISGDYDQRVAILFSEFQRPLYGFIEIDRLANLPTRIRSVILFID